MKLLSMKIPNVAGQDSDTELKYRPDIDGLRALAVIPVIAFHYHLGSVFRGGFVGVDIFFVISGFLISGIIFNGINSGKYSVCTFYDHRIRRIFPALFVTYLACLFASLILQFPSETRGVATSVISSALFFSNVYFYTSSGYFEQALQQNPLLHTWSLSVEEQFYIGFPILVYFLRGFDRRVQVIVIAVIAVLSFGLSVWMVHLNAQQAFYLVPYRAWELLIGTLLALKIVPPLSKPWSELFGLLGVGAILVSIRYLSPATPFPGLAALPACIGAAAIIHSGRAAGTFTSRMLSLSPVKFVGLISYSLYLWHWPIYVFAAQYHNLSLGMRWALIVFSILVASLSWLCVERPFRGNSWKKTELKNLQWGAGGVLSIVLVAFLVMAAAPLLRGKAEITEKLLAYESYNPGASYRENNCFLTTRSNDFSFFDAARCVTKSASKPNVLIIGDSHAADLWAGLQETYPQIHFLQATASGCLPVVGGAGARRCTDMTKYIVNQYLRSGGVSAVIISARWTEDSVPQALQTAALIARPDRRVLIVGPVSEYFPSLSRVLALASAQHLDYGLFAAEHRRPDQAIIDRKFLLARMPKGVLYLSAYKITSTNVCPLVDGKGVPIQFDYGHFTDSGARCMARKIGTELSIRGK